MRKLIGSRKRISTGAALLVLLPATAFSAYPDCPATHSKTELEAWRLEGLIHANDRTPESNFALRVEACFPTGIPACLKRPHAVSEKRLLTWNTDFTPEEEKMKLPPREFQANPDLPNLNYDTPYVLSRGVAGTPEYKDVEQVAKEKGWPLVRYKSRHSGGFDRETASFIMIHVPGDRLSPPTDYDQYINISIPEDPVVASAPQQTPVIEPLPSGKIPAQEQYKGPTKLPGTFTIVTVQKKKGSRPPKVVFSKFDRYSDTSPYYNQTAVNPSASCFSCHPNGIRAISPLGFHIREGEKSLPQETWLAVNAMNNAMDRNNGYALPDWGKTLDTSGKPRASINFNGLGPVYGPLRPLARESVIEDGQKKTTYPTRSQNFIVGADGKSGCAYSRPSVEVRDIFERAPGKDNVFKMTPSPAVNWEKVRDSMNCASCHNNQIRGALSMRTDEKLVAYKILVDQSMPMGAHRNPLDQSQPNAHVYDELNPNERIALFSCLADEFKGELSHQTDWMTEIPCNDEQNASHPAAPGTQVIGGQLSNVPGGGRATNPGPDVPPQAISDSPERPTPTVTPPPTPTDSGALH